MFRSSELDPSQGPDRDCQLLVLDISDEDVHHVDVPFNRVTDWIELQSVDTEMPLCIAVLPSAQAAPSLAGGVQQEACKKLLAVQRRLHDLGVHEVVFHGVSVAETHLSVLMALQRLECRHAAWTALAADIRQQERTLASKLLTERMNELHQQWADEMWAHASELSVAKVLPALDASLPTKIVAGVEVRELQLEAVLGQGGYGTVCLARNRATSEPEAAKIFSKQRLGSLRGLLGVASEVQALRRLQHVNVASLLGVLHSRRQILVRMEFTGRLTLMQILRENRRVGLPESQVQDLFRQLLSGMVYCHRRGVAHCDIKPENLGVNDERTRLKILDFGCASRVDAVLDMRTGTMLFMAPEVLLGHAYAPAPADVWAMGVVLAEMLAGVGSLNRLMGWPADIKDFQHAGEELSAVLAHSPRAIRNMVCDACGCACAELADLLDAASAVAPCDRASAAQLAQSAWLLRGDGAPEAAGARRLGNVEALPPPRQSGRGQPPSRLRYCKAVAKGDGQATTLGGQRLAAGSSDAGSSP